MKTRLKYLGIALLIISVFMLITSSVYAEPDTIALPKLGFTVESSDDPQDVSTTIQIIVLLTVLTLAPSILIMMTSFVRIIIVLSFFRNAIGTQQMPPNQVLIGLALFLTLFIMRPVLTEINDTAFKPYSNQEITQEVALESLQTLLKGLC